jgi:hypothetical protein
VGFYATRQRTGGGITMAKHKHRDDGGGELLERAKEGAKV